MSQKRPLFSLLLLAVFHAVNFATAQAQQTSLESVLNPFVKKSELAGAVAIVADKDKLLQTATVGFADVQAKEPMKADSIFWIASQTKPMTAVAVMMLVDEGKIALDDAVERYLPEFKNQMVIVDKDKDEPVLGRPNHPTTIRETLSHMSGLPFKSVQEEPTLDGLPLAEAVQSYAITPLQTQPGTHYQYSNAGINTAARIIEVVTGEKYEDFMYKRLFEPLGMKDTTFWPNDEQVKRVAKSYRPDAAKTGLEEFRIGQLTYPLNDRTRRYPMPAGGLFSTAQDTMKFCQMMLNRGEFVGHKFLSPAAFNELTKRQTPATVKESYGLGFSVGGDWFGHGGAHATNMEVHLDKGLAVVWMVQHAGFPGEGAKAQAAFKEWAFSKK